MKHHNNQFINFHFISVTPQAGQWERRPNNIVQGKVTGQC